MTVNSAWRASVTFYSPVRLGDGTTITLLHTASGPNPGFVQTSTGVDLNGNAWKFGYHTFTHTYSNPGNYTIEMNSCCRVQGLENNSNAYYRIATVANIGSGNNPPVSTLPTIVNVPTGLANATIQVPAFDPDGDNLTYRLSNSSEAGGNSSFTQPNGLSIDPNSGLMTWNTIGRTVGELWTASVVIEDRDGAGNVKSFIMLDFIFQISASTAPPEYIAPTPPGNTNFSVNPGQNLTFEVQGEAGVSGNTVSLNAAGLPGGATMSPSLPTSFANPTSSTFSWTPTVNDLGSLVVTFTLTDNTGVQTLRSFSISVTGDPIFTIPDVNDSESYCLSAGFSFSQLYQVSDLDPDDNVSISYSINNNPPTTMPSPPTPPGGFPFKNALPTTLNFSPGLPTTAANPTSTTLSGTVAASDWGIYPFQIIATDDFGGTTTLNQFIFVDTPPFFTSTAPANTETAYVGQAFNLTFTTDDTDKMYGDAVRFADPGKPYVTVPSWMTLTDNGDGTATLTGTPTINDVGLHPVSIEIHDRTTHYLHTHCTQAFQTFNIDVLACNISLAANTTDESCPTLADGAIDLTITNPSGANITSISWNNGAYTTEDISSLGDGSYTVVVTDANNCTATATYTVNETADLTPPTITCPPTVNVNMDANACEATNVSLGTPTTSDNCLVTSVYNNAANAFSVGNTTVTWTVEDVGQFSNTCTQTVTVIDNQPPAITCPTDVPVNTDLGSCEATGVNLGTPSTSDNCGINNALLSNDAPNSFGLGNNTVTWTVFDVNGVSNTCTQNVMVTDNELPSIICPSDTQVDTDDGLCGTSVLNIGTPTLNDNCGIDQSSLQNDLAIFVNMSNTSVAVTWTVEDDNGNSNMCTQTITVVDDEAPSITCPSAAQANTDPGTCGATNVSLGTPSASDNCGVNFFSLQNDISGPLGLGNNTVTWTIEDNSGNSNTCTQTVTVVDNEQPSITCPTDVQVNTDQGLCGAGNIQLGTPTTSDNCGVNLQTLQHDLGVFVNMGTSSATVTWSVEDNSGNSNTCEQLITITDNEAPSITCPSAVQVNNDAGECYATVANLGTPSANDNCSVDFSTLSNDATSIFNVGSHTITWSVEDESGNSNTCTQSIMVTDNEAPSITCPATVAVNNDEGECDATISALGTPVTDDNCSVNISSLSSDAVSSYNVGSHTVTWTVTDIHGNSSNCTQSITVMDNEAPSITCPSAVAVNNDEGECNAAITLQNPITGDNCGVANFNSDATPTFAVGGHTVTWTVTDIHGNSSNCTQSITVTDNEMPSITCPTSVSVNNDLGECYATISSLGTPITGDNCSVDNFSSDATSTFAVGGHTVTWTVEDIHGNSNTCTQSITVTDNEMPSITCPTSVSVNNDLGECYATIASLGTPITGDNCSVDNFSSDATSTFAVGGHTVTWTVEDIHGNSNTCTQSIIVTDNEMPSITCPSSVSVNNDLGECYATIASLGTPITGDNCGVDALNSNATPTFDVGSHTVTWTVEDIHGKSNTCTQSITVTDNEAPTALCSAITVQLDINGEASIVAEAIDGGEVSLTDSYDNCGIESLEISTTSFDCSDIGGNFVQLEVRDIHGNLAYCNTTVTVEDNIAPTVLCQPFTAELNSLGTAALQVADINNGSTDACGVSSMTLSTNSFDCSALGSNPVTLTIVDNHGNSASCSTTVMVEDNLAPKLTCPGDIQQSTDLGLCETNVDFEANIVADNCGEVEVTYSHQPNDVFQAGNTSVLVTATDESGNSTEGVFSIIVVDNEPPSVNCPDNMAFSSAFGNDILVTFEADATDNCGVTNAVSSHDSGDMFQPGTTTVTYTVSDGSNNQTTCTFDVIITGPSDEHCPDEIQVSLSEETEENAPIYWNFPSATDCPECPRNNDFEDMKYLGEWRGHKYFISTLSHFTWEEAMERTHIDYGYLLSINSEEENEFLKSVIPDDFAGFMGLSENGIEGVFEWADGHQMDFENWDPTALDQNTNDYGVFMGDGSWMAVTQNTQHAYIVEYTCIDYFVMHNVKDMGDYNLGNRNITYTGIDACGNVYHCEFPLEVYEETEVNYCETKGKTDQLWLDVLEWNGLEMESGNSNDGYEHFNLTELTLTYPSTVPFSIKTKGALTEREEPIFVHVWIDYNGDGDFYEKDEIVYRGKTYADLSGEIALPEDIEIENTRMRVAVSSNPMLNPCLDFDYGEVEDYDVTFQNIDTNADIQSLTLFPNPSSHNVYLDLETVSGQPEEIIIQNAYGQVIKTKTVENWVGKTVQLRLDGLVSGFYLVTLKTDVGIYASPLVVEKKGEVSKQ